MNANDLFAALGLPPSAWVQQRVPKKLLTEHEMGELFKVIGFGAQGVEWDALGFARGDRSHVL
jgi:hypothetical protein